MRVGHNLSALNTTRLLNANTRKQSAIAEKLSSGFRINRAGDNAAGLSISEKMRAQIRGLNQSSRNAQDGISLIETADGALDEIHNIVQRMRELSVQAANGTSTEEDKKMIQTEIDELTKEVNRISNDTEFNDIKLLNGNLAEDVSSYISLNELLESKSNGLNIVYTDNEYRTEQSAVGAATNGNVKYDNLKEILKKEIVPQAISKIIRTFSPAFDYLSSSTVGIGLKLEESNSRALASVSSHRRWGGDMYFTNYTLTVNTKNLLDSSGNITASKRKELEAIVAHEFVHGVMDEALTCGMAGVANEVQNNNNKFPLWFVEGMAQTASGGYANFNDFVNYGLGIGSDTSVEDISRIVRGQYRLSNSGSDGTGRSSYGVGYLACMYLGYLANGASDISEQSIRTGLSNILKEMVGGKDLSTVIKEKTNNGYTSLRDFQNKFVYTHSCSFIKELTIRVGEGNGSLVAGNYNTDDILPDEEIPMTLFDLNTNNETVKNLYPSDVKMLSGGGASISGPEPIAGYKDSVGGSQSGGTVDPPPTSGSGDVNPPIVDPPVQPGSRIDLSNIGSIDGIDYNSSSNTLTVTKNGDYTLSGVNSTGTKVVVRNGVQANITLDNAKINTSSGEGIKLERNSNVTLKVTGDNTITATEAGKAAIGVTEGATLNIEGDGKLTAKGAELAASIGGGLDESAGTINIKSGQVIAESNENGGAGIGGGMRGAGGNINITGGTITATGGIGAAGIGGGLAGASGNIKIDGESAVVNAKGGSGAAENIGAGSGASSSNVDISKGIVSDGVNWSAHGSVVIKTTIRVSGTFTSQSGSTITIADGGNIGGTGSINVESGSTIKVESGGVIDAASTINNRGNIDNRGKITTPCNSDSQHRIKNYINKIFNDLESQLRINIGQTLQEVLTTPTIQVLSNGERKQLTSSEVEIFDSNNRRISNLSDVTVNRGDRFTYKVSFNLDKSSNEYFDEDGVVDSRLLQHNYKTVSQGYDYSNLLDTVISNGGKTITYTYALKANDSESSSSGTVEKGNLNLQIGANFNQLLGINIEGMSTSDLGLDTISVATAENASKAIDSCDEAIKKVSTTRSKLGAYQNRLEHTIANLDNSEENLQQSESRIRDLDMAKGMAEYSKYQILTQVDQAILSQANQMANSVLNLLRA